MRKIIVGTFVSLDGIMQAPGGPEEDTTGGFAFGGWVFPYWDEAAGEAIDGIFSKPFDLLLGRKTYEIFSAYWPFHGEDPIGERFNAATKFVVTSLPEPLAWHNSVPIRGDVPAELARLKEEDGPDLVVQGSSVLIQTLLACRLVDELRIQTFPVLLGKGKRLFGEAVAPGALDLVDSRTSSTGVIISHYVPAGEVRTGSFADERPSDVELARRERWKRVEAGR